MEFKEFLNPKSMLTPAAAGGLVMLITNTLWIQFGCQQSWMALMLSYLFAFSIVYPYKSKIIIKGIYIILNGLIIFSFAASTNFAGQTMVYTSPSRVSTTQESSNLIKVSPEQNVSKPRKFFGEWFDLRSHAS